MLIKNYATASQAIDGISYGFYKVHEGPYFRLHSCLVDGYKTSIYILAFKSTKKKTYMFSSSRLQELVFQKKYFLLFYLLLYYLSLTIFFFCAI